MSSDENKRRARLEKLCKKGPQQRPRPRPRPESLDSNDDSQPSSDEGVITNGFGAHPQQYGANDVDHKQSCSLKPGPPVCPPVSVPRAKGFEPVPMIQLPSDPHMYWRLTEEERALLTHISATYQNTILRLPQKVRSFRTAF